MVERWTPALELEEGLGADLAPVSETHLWGTVRDAAGRATCPVRSVLHGVGARGRRLFLNQAAADGSGLRLLPAGGLTARGAPAVVDVEVLRSSTDADGRAWTVRTDGRTLRWDEDSTLRLTGAATSAALVWRLGGDVPVRYRAQVFRVAGTVGDTPVTGFLGLDRVHLLTGAFYRDDPIARNGLLVAMFSFATEWPDGSVESGVVAVGHDGFGYAAIHRPDQPALVTTDVDVDVVRDEGGYWPLRMDVRIAAERWEWIGDAGLRFVDYGGIENPQVDGRFRRVGDAREPVRWFAQGETVPGHGDRPRG